LKVLDGLSGKEFFSREVAMNHAGGRLVINPSEELLVHEETFPGRSLARLVRLSDGACLGSLPSLPSALSPQGRDYVVGDLGSKGFGLYALGDENASIVLGIEKPISSEACYNRAGTHLAWGNMDGTVTVCDLEEVHRRLDELGLGW
jgi:hypothetical protein